MKKILNIVLVSLFAMHGFAIDWEGALADYNPNESQSKVRKSHVASKAVNPDDFQLLAPEKGMVRQSYNYWKGSGSNHDAWFNSITDQIISKQITPAEVNIDTSAFFLGSKPKQIEMFIGSLKVKDPGYYVIVVERKNNLSTWYCSRLFINGNEIFPSTHVKTLSTRVYLHAGFNEFKFLGEFWKDTKYEFSLRKDNSLKTFPIGPANFYYEADSTGNGEADEESPFM